MLCTTAKIGYITIFCRTAEIDLKSYIFGLLIKISHVQQRRRKQKQKALKIERKIESTFCLRVLNAFRNFSMIHSLLLSSRPLFILYHIYLSKLEAADSFPLHIKALLGERKTQIQSGTMQLMHLLRRF